MIKKIAIVTGTRAEYGSIYSILKKIEKSNVIKPLLYVTGLHLLKKYGYTIEKIKEDNIQIHSIIPMYQENAQPKDLGLAIGEAIKNFSQAFYNDKPDILLVSGDRFEIFCAVIAASTLGIAIAHIHGGDRSDFEQVDDCIRHSISKFAHIHFPGTKGSAEILEKMGEEKSRIFCHGSPFIDQIYTMKLLSKEEIFKKLNLKVTEITILCVFHPYIPEANEMGAQMDILLKTLKEINFQTIILYPNNDPGSDEIINVIEKNQNVKSFKIFKSLTRLEYLSLLKSVDLFIGNSSSGCVETPTLKTPSIITGRRNITRVAAPNVMQNIQINKTSIKKAISMALSEEFKTKCQTVISPYGNGKASEKIVHTLETIKIDQKFLLKKLSYK